MDGKATKKPQNTGQPGGEEASFIDICVHVHSFVGGVVVLFFK